MQLISTAVALDKGLAMFIPVARGAVNCASDLVPGLGVLPRECQ
jgi:hypothetical protein